MAVLPSLSCVVECEVAASKLIACAVKLTFYSEVFICVIVAPLPVLEDVHHFACHIKIVHACVVSVSTDKHIECDVNLTCRYGRRAV